VYNFDLDSNVEKDLHHFSFSTYFPWHQLYRAFSDFHLFGIKYLQARLKLIWIFSYKWFFGVQGVWSGIGCI
jgi:hypothetical protein